MERITPNGHRVVIYNPRRYTKRTLFNRVLKELKAKEIKINLFSVCVLRELKERYKPDFKHDGNIYHWRWVRPIHSKFAKNAYFKCDYKCSDGITLLSMLKFNRDNIYLNEFLDDWLKNYNYKLITKVVDVEDSRKYRNSVGCYMYQTISRTQVEEYYLERCKEGIWWKTLSVDDLMDNAIYHFCNGKGLPRFNDVRNQSYKEKPKDFYTIRIKLKKGHMDLTKTKTPDYSPLNLKYWDKNGNTSNKGLKGIYPYNWVEKSWRGGWIFGGIKVDTMKMLCQENKMPNFNKKMKYGELANWWYKGLM